jgi:uncharacterized repeat protein (TIGR03803 family)
MKRTAVVIMFALTACSAAPGGGAVGNGNAYAAVPHASGYRILHVFTGYGDSDGGNPTSGLTERSGVFYGTTMAGGSIKLNNQGAVFSITPAGEERVVYSFNTTDGAKPFAALTADGDRLYGTTIAGGTANNGVIFEVNAADELRVLYNFAGGTDGATPAGGMLALDGALYGTTNAGGSGNSGTVFKHNLTDGIERVLYAFTGGAGGSMPRGTLISSGGALYGTTLQGGEKAGGGTVFELIPSGSSVLRTVYRFKNAPDAVNPVSGLVELDGAFYGTSQGGGATGFGAIYEVRKTGEERVVYSFKGGDDGYAPLGGLIVVNGLLYGTTSQGGRRSSGTIFEVSKSGQERVVYTFQGGKDGSQPNALVYKDNTFYGTTRYGGGSNKCALGCGTIFALTL